MVGSHRRRERRSRSLTARVGRAAAILLLGWATLLGAGTAAADTLVSNLGETTSGVAAALSGNDRSQVFTRGADADAYELTGVKVKFATLSGDHKPQAPPRQ